MVHVGTVAPIGDVAALGIIQLHRLGRVAQRQQQRTGQSLAVKTQALVNRRIEAPESLKQFASTGKDRAAAEKHFFEGLLKLGRSAEELSREEAEEILAELIPLKEKRA